MMIRDHLRVTFRTFRRHKGYALINAAGLVAAAVAVALPVVYIVLDRWLEGFAFRIELGWGIFLVPILFVGSVALVSISIPTLKACLADPATSLRQE